MSKKEKVRKHRLNVGKKYTYTYEIIHVCNDEEEVGEGAGLMSKHDSLEDAVTELERLYALECGDAGFMAWAEYYITCNIAGFPTTTDADRAVYG